ncbi:2-dehydro-3-deoxygalactonokinase [Falsiphaeobacter marinintestinus]|uniref:2-dehydro-3-deoxygalactonokinase n=1 Tax=Falsiphaeobacter marinintestinus TaxID=1492905 RepID=UPI0011B6D3A4|nr:2-dehydro-3-deoxygalactonokinase [Phaeobacter marinintestinus]
MTVNAEWISVDWGTSHLRAWAMDGTEVVARATSDNGMGQLSKDDFEPALVELVGDWCGSAPVDVVACGMVGARQGWFEVPYAAVPTTPMPKTPMRIPDTTDRFRVFVVPGLKQAKPADVMRGEETQIAGFLSLNPGWDGVICLPGTHTKWAHISADEVVSFQTFMTGELFNLLSTASVLRHSIGDGWDQDAFAEAMDETLSRPERLAARLFGLRAGDLLDGQDPDRARARLSGMLIGTELAAARPYWLGQQVAVIGADALAGIYVQALARQGVPAQALSGTEMTLAGLIAARMTLETQT